MQRFAREIGTAEPPASVLPELVSTLTPPLGRYGYKLQTQTETALTYGLTYRPWYVWVLVVVLTPVFLLGLLFLFLSETATITIVLEPKNGGTLIRVNGEGPRRVEQAFEQMEI